MLATFQSIAQLLEEVEAIKNRLEIIDSTADYLKTLDAEEIEPAVNVMVASVLGKYLKGSSAVKANITQTNTLSR